jgi:ZIP family zinc transporter
VLTFAIIVVVSGALLLGAAWGIFWPMSGTVEGLLVAIAGGALLVSSVLELIEPATEHVHVIWVSVALLAGAAVFTGIDYAVDERWGSDKGGGLLAAITLDGVPENLALGVALIGAEPLTVAALAGSILLSNLPEAAGGAKEMAEGGRSNGQVFGLWAATALVLSASALVGNLLLVDASDGALALIRSFAAGAVIASLATEVFPKAFHEDRYFAGIATTIGAVLAILLDAL